MVKEGRLASDSGMTARRRMGASLAPGIVLALVLGFATRQIPAAILGGWDLSAVTFLVWTWRSVWPLDQEASRMHAEREDPTQSLADAVLLTAAVVSLAAVAVVLTVGRSDKGGPLVENLALAVGSVVCSWAVVHTVFALKYAQLYYEGTDGGIDFHGDHPPTYVDFAYLSFTVGMTFQVSDTEIQDRAIRATVLRQALIAYLFGAVILAVTINLLAGLSK